MNTRISLICLVACWLFTNHSAKAQVDVKLQEENTQITLYEQPLQQASFEAESIDFGTIKKGDKKEHRYVFTNTGTTPLEIELASGCECTTLDWSRGQILPGDQGSIDIIFDSTEKDSSEVVDVDVIFAELPGSEDPPLFKILNFKFELNQ